MLAVNQMSAGWQAFFYCLAFVLFVVAGVIAVVKDKAHVLALIAFGLAAAVLVFAYNAIAAA